MQGFRFSRHRQAPTWPWPGDTKFKITTVCSCGAQATLEAPTQEGLIAASTAWHDTHPCPKRCSD